MSDAFIKTDEATIAALLQPQVRPESVPRSNNRNAANSLPSSFNLKPLPNDIKHLGPVSWNTGESGPCVICDHTISSIKIDGEYHCILHALEEINYKVISVTYPEKIELCNCERGLKTNYNQHTKDCN